MLDRSRTGARRPGSGARVPSLVHQLVPRNERNRPVMSVHDAANRTLAVARLRPRHPPELPRSRPARRVRHHRRSPRTHRYCHRQRWPCAERSPGARTTGRGKCLDHQPTPGVAAWNREPPTHRAPCRNPRQGAGAANGTLQLEGSPGPAPLRAASRSRPQRPFLFDGRPATNPAPLTASLPNASTTGVANRRGDLHAPGVR